MESHWDHQRLHADKHIHEQNGKTRSIYTQNLGQLSKLSYNSLPVLIYLW